MNILKKEKINSRQIKFFLQIQTLNLTLGFQMHTFKIHNFAFTHLFVKTSVWFANFTFKWFVIIICPYQEI